MRPSVSFKEQRRFQEFARGLVRLPAEGEDPLAHLLPEARWEELCRQEPEVDTWLMALSQATGVYFFPSREWVPLFLRYLKGLKVRRLMEAGAGRGYLTAALAPLAEAAGLTFKAIDRGEGEFQAGLPRHPKVEVGDVFTAIYDLRPEVVLYAWPPPGQSVAKIFRAPLVRYLILVGETEGGATGARQDWETLPHKVSPVLSRYGRGRTGPQRSRVTVFWGGGGG
ncbi:MAG: hypothetical protein Q8M54_11685 [Desulfobaccales bacterium]|nr:hypothetical protein [Desulfobaccales bacterium]